jgi:hypothetical protein
VVRVWYQTISGWLTDGLIDSYMCMHICMFAYPSSSTCLSIRLCIYTRAIRKITFGELLTRQTTRKKILYTKNTYKIKLLLNVVTHCRFRSSPWTFVRPLIFEHETPLSYSSFTPYIFATNGTQFTMNFRSTHAFSAKKKITRANSVDFASGGLFIKRRTQRTLNSFCRDKNNH